MGCQCKDMALCSPLVNPMFEFESSIKNMKKVVFSFDGRCIFILMKTIVLNEDLNKAIRYIRNVDSMLEAGVEINADGVNKKNEISFTSRTRDKRQQDVGLLVQ